MTERFGSRITVSHFEMERMSDYDFLERRLHRQKHELMQHLADKMEDGKYYTIRLSEVQVRDRREFVHFDRHLAVFVSPTQNVVIPTVVWDNGVIKEWRCGHCETPHDFKHRYCTQCGAPRAQLIQEIE